MGNLDNAGKISEHIQLDWSNLLDYLSSELEIKIDDCEIKQFHGGHANLSFLIRSGDKEFVLRRPPMGKIAQGAHDMKREFLVLSKLNPYYPQAPKAYLYCDDHRILGAEFIVMERRHGVVVRYQLTEPLSFIENIEERLTTALIQAQNELHQLDPDKIGLSSLGKPVGFLERQLRGWNKRAGALTGGDKTLLQDIHKVLNKIIPDMQRVSIIHNDFKFDNCQFDLGDPDTVASVFDWDMATLGDPLFDLASSLAYWPDDFFTERNLPSLLKGNFPHKNHLKELYFELSKLDPSDFVWYEALAYWKTSIIAQQLLDRYLALGVTDPKMEKFKIFAPAFALKAKELSGKL